MKSAWTNAFKPSAVIRPGSPGPPPTSHTQPFCSSGRDDRNSFGSLIPHLLFVILSYHEIGRAGCCCPSTRRSDHSQWQTEVKTSAWCADPASRDPDLLQTLSISTAVR